MTRKIYLIDAYAHIYRGFHAIQKLTTKSGMPTNALFAFARFLINFEKEYSPDFGVVAFDKWPPAARLQLHPEYKAQRPPMPDDLRSQIESIRKIIRLSGWKIVEKEGFEADDIIASLARKFSGDEIFIISNDKDLSQLVNDRVSLLVTSSGEKGFQVRNSAAVMEKFGVAPEQIVDYLSLTGDTSDNIRGIDGLGPKTAAKLLQEFSTLDNLIVNVDRVGNEKIRVRIKENIDRLKVNKQIIALDSAAPTESVEAITDTRIELPDIDKIESFCREFELLSLIPEFKKLYEKKLNPMLF